MQQIAAFNALYPNVTVQVETSPYADYWTRLQTAVAGGGAPDVFWMNGPSFPAYASQGALEPLDVDVSNFPKNLVGMYTWNGQLYGVPKDFDTRALFYNKTLFDAAGVAYPSADWTWDDLRAAAKKLTVASGATVTQWGYGNSTSMDANILPFIFQNGGTVLNEDGTKSTFSTPASCGGLQFLYDIQHDGSSPDGATQQAAGWDLTKLFISGKIAMYPSGSWDAGTVHAASSAFDVAPLPHGTAQATVIHGLGQVVAANSQNKAAAKAFVAFLGTAPAQKIFATNGSAIPAMNGLQTDWVASIPQMDLQVFIDAVDYAIPYPATPAGEQWLNDAQKVIQDSWLGRVSRADLCMKASAAADPDLTK